MLGYFDPQKFQKELSLLPSAEFAKLFSEIRLIRTAEKTMAFTRALTTPFQMDKEMLRKFSDVFKAHGVKQTLTHPLDAQESMIVLMAEAVERSMR